MPLSPSREQGGVLGINETRTHEHADGPTFRRVER